MRFVLAAALFAAVSGIACAQSPHERLRHLADESDSRSVDPIAREVAFDRRLERNHYRDVLAKVRAIPAKGLSPTDRVTRSLIELQSRWALERLESPFLEHTLLIPLEGGLAADLVQRMTRQPFGDPADLRAWMKRLSKYPALLAGARARLEAAMGEGVTTPRVLVEKTLDQWERIAAGEPRASTLWAPAERYPPPLQREYEKLLGDRVLPAMRDFTRFVREDYLPRARTTDSLADVPGGERLYADLVRQQGTADLTPDAVHEIGLAEVKRIQLQVMLAAGQAGFKGELRDLRTWLRADSNNFPFTRSEDALEYLRGIHARVIPQLPKLFARMPRAPLEITPTDPVPVGQAREASIATLTSQLLHEGMPGRHLERALARERSLPRFRRDLQIDAYGEGWALYAQSLGHEMGLYNEPIPLIGRYLDELHRAARLVADTGLHSKGWSRARAIEFLMEAGGLPERPATHEVLRYMALPSQALADKLGEIAIAGLRSRAQRELGDAFDIRDFHECILGEGQVPLDILRARVDEWIARRSRPTGSR
jgi:uncharacterized protein (DUF885 family)